MTFADKLAKLRKDAGYSQEDLAEKLNVSRQTIYKWESGNALPDALNLKQISAIFNMSLDVLLSDDDLETTSLAIPGEPEENVSLDEVPEPDKASSDSITKKGYGEVTITDLTLKKVNVESDNVPMVAKVQNIYTTRQTICIICIIIAMFAFVTFIYFLVEYSTIGLALSLVFLILSTIAGFACYFLYGTDTLYTLTSRSQFKKKAEKAEEYMTEKNYWFVRLQYDMLAWFFYDDAKSTFGFYFLDGEQFVCPMQNYISFTCNGEGGGIEQIGTQTSGGAIVGAAPGVVVTRTAVYGNRSDTDYFFSLHYYDINGGINEYAYKLTAYRAYPSYIPGNKDAEMRMYRERCAKSTRDAYTQIMGHLEGGKSKLK